MRAMNPDRMFAVAQALSEAKGRQDVQAAMKLLHPGMLLETPAFGTRVPGDAQVEETLRGSF